MCRKPTMFSPAVDSVFGNIQVLSNLLNIHPRLGTHVANLVCRVGKIVFNRLKPIRIGVDRLQKRAKSAREKATIKSAYQVAAAALPMCITILLR